MKKSLAAKQRTKLYQESGEKTPTSIVQKTTQNVNGGKFISNI